MEQAVRRAANGAAGTFLLMEGGTGIGKTSVLQAAAALGQENDLRVMRGGGSAIDRDLAFGAVRQLLEPVLSSFGAHERDALFAGSATVVRPLFDGCGQGAEEAALVDGLAWLVVNLCEVGPLLLTADDLHWWDRESLRFLDHLVRRLESLPTAIVGAMRTGDPISHPGILRSLLSHPCVDRRPLRALSPDAICALAAAALGSPPTERFVEAVRDVTRGNPLYVSEILESVHRTGARPDDLAAQRVAGIVPASLTESAQARIEALGASAVAVARAVAVLGRHAASATTALLADMTEEELARSADELEAHGVLARSRPLEFSHPVVRAAVLERIPTGRRLQMHRSAADLLRAAAASGDDIAAHLLETEPVGDAETAKMLHTAAASTASPDRALALLRRALAEPPAAANRLDILLAIGDLETRGYEPAALERLNEARALAPDRPTERRALLALTRAWTFDNRPQEVVALVDRELAQLEDGDDPGERELRLALLALRVIRGPLDRERALELREAARADASSAGRYLLAALAYKGFAWGEAEESRALAEEALARGMAAEGVRATGFILVNGALEAAGARLRSIENIRAAMRAARDSGDLSGYVLALCLHADVVALRSVIDARAEIRDALALSAGYGLDWIEPALAARAAEIGIETGKLDEADDLLGRHIPGGWSAASSRAAQFFQSRARLRAAQGQHQEALADALRAGEICRRFTIDHVAIAPWQLTAARALAGLGRTDEARARANEALSQARDYACPEVTGRALLAAAVTRDQADAHEALEEAVEVLEAGEAPLPLVHAHVALGTSLRRLGARKRAQEQTAAGFDLATGIGATVLADRALAELHALGARPRRAARWGPDALTPSERRVAELAAAGLSNKDIAQELFVSPRTVGNQLQRAYLKLAIRSRQELSAALSRID